jgi:hypothetical protein
VADSQKFFDEHFGHKQRVGLRRVVIWCYDAMHLISVDDPRGVRFRVTAARQQPGLRWYVTIENLEISPIEAPRKTSSRRRPFALYLDCQLDTTASLRKMLITRRTKLRGVAS